MEATYDRVGASPKIAQAHKWALAFSMSLNGGFFLFATLALWLSKIGALPLRGVTPCSHAHLVVASIALAMVPLWMLMVSPVSSNSSEPILTCIRAGGQSVWSVSAASSPSVFFPALS
jgi:hypothetical protein